MWTSIPETLTPYDIFEQLEEVPDTLYNSMDPRMKEIYDREAEAVDVDAPDDAIEAETKELGMSGRGRGRGRDLGHDYVHVPTRMMGQGLLSGSAALLEAAKAVDKLAFGPIGTSISNTLSHAFNKNPKWRPGFPGEKHIVLPTDEGITRANFAGPGTRLDKRLPRGDQGVDGPRGIDSAAKKHDIAYSKIHRGQPDAVAATRKADIQMLKDIDNSTATATAKKVVKTAMRAKVFAEDLGVLDPLKFSGGRIRQPLKFKKSKAKGRGKPKPKPKPRKPRGKPGKMRPGMKLRLKLKSQGRL